MHKSPQCSCLVQELLSKVNDIPAAQDFVKIARAEKIQTESNKSSSSFISYTISIQNIKEAKRRYSEFESFRRSLVRLHPTALIPPIPEKHSLSDYASDYTSQKQKDDAAIIEKRKRMLQRFLTRLVVHPILKKEHVLHCFLDGNYTWHDIRHSAPLLNLPKDPLLPIDNSFASSIASNLPLGSQTTNGVNTTSNIPIPSSSYTLKYPDKEFEEAESKVDKTARHTTAQFEKSQKRILRRLGDLSNDYGELGSAYNALSLNESGVASTSIEKLGQVIDGSSKSTKAMVDSLEVEFAEHVQDYTQYVYIAKQILRYRRMKQSQLELIEELIDSKQGSLRSLMKTEDESEKLKSSMDQLSVSPVPTKATSKSGSYSSGSMVDEDSNIDTESIEDGFSAIIKSSSGVDEENSEDNNKETIVDSSYPPSASAPILRASKNQTKKWSSPRKLFSAVTYTIQGMIDTDPEQTRRNQILKLKESIAHLEQARSSIRQEIKDMSIEIQEDFDRLQTQKEVELRAILISFAKIHMRFCEQNMTSWESIRNDVEITMENML